MVQKRMYRRFWLRKPAGWGKRRVRLSSGALQFLLSAVIGVGGALFLIGLFDHSVRPIIAEMAVAKVKNTVTQIVNSAVSHTLDNQAVAYSDMVTFQTDGTGRITALTTNSAEMNRLRTEITEEIIRQINAIDTMSLGVPLGNLTGFSSLSGRGAQLPVEVLAVETPRTAFSNAFSEAGINQTHHRVMLQVDIDVDLLIPGGSVHTTVDSQVCIAETILLGEVPDTFLQLSSAGLSP